MYCCRLFRSQIADARNCTKEANAREGCLFNSLSVDSEITDADVSFSIACGFNSGKILNTTPGSVKWFDS